MNKLQKLFENRIPFKIGGSFPFSDTVHFILFKYEGHEPFRMEGFENTVEKAIESLWQLAKKHYPDADCFKEEREEG